MSETASLTVRLPAGIRAKLAELAAKTRRTNSALAGEAIAAFVSRELEAIDHIEAARENIRAGRYGTQDDVIAGARAIIAELQQKK